LKKEKTMVGKSLEQYRQLLEAMADRLQGHVGGLREEAMQTTGGENSGGLSNVPLHLADLANRHWEEEITLGLVGNEEKILGEIEAALTRCKQGNFGHCERCQKAISRERLDALPYTRFCVKCARKEEANP
jgi:DnaK suppressor protein